MALFNLVFPLKLLWGDMLQLMILVDDAGGIFPAINHSPWDSVTLADFVMPFFLFMVGVSIALAYKVWFSQLRVLFFGIGVRSA